MTMFGVNILLNNIRHDTNFIDEVVDNTLKRSDERKIFKRFLDSEISSGRKVVGVLTEASSIEAEKLLKSEEKIGGNILFDFAVKSLKSKTNGHLSFYDSLVRKIIEDQDPRFIILHKQIDNGNFNGKLPLGYPDSAKKAEGVLAGKIKDSLPNIKLEFLVQKLVGEKVRKFTKEMFYVINKFNLSGGNLVKYLCILYELSLKQVAPTENGLLLKKQISESIQQNIPLELVYIKSLRYAYPGGTNMRVIDHLGDDETKNSDGTTRHYFNEYLILERLSGVKRVLENYGLQVNLTILVADNDLDILFPPGSRFVPDDDIILAKISAQKYTDNLRSAAGFLTQNTYPLAEFLRLKRLEKRYKDKARIVYLDAKGPKRIVPEADVEERVNYRYGFFGGIYGESYSRDDARETMCNQIAHVMALSEVFKSFKCAPMVVVDFRGNESKLIGGLDPGSRSVFLTKLKEPTIIEKAK